MTFLVLASYADSLLNFRGQLLDELIARNFSVHVAAPDLPKGSSLRESLEAKGLHVHDIPLRRAGMNPFTDVKTLLSLLSLMCRVRPEYVFAYTAKPVIYGMIVAALAKVPRRTSLITGLGYTFQGEGDNNQRFYLRMLVKRLYAFAMRRAHLVFFQNPDDQLLFHELGLLKPSTPSCVVNGSGVDITKFNVSPLPTSPHFLLIARLLGDKGVREYVEAARLIHNKYPETTFSLVGWLDENPDTISQGELQSWIDEGIVDYLGKLEDVRPAIAASSVYVLPSYREGTPRTVLEAMAMGRAIITTDAPGCRETVINGANGLLVPVKDVGQLACAMQRFIQEPDLASRMGKLSRQIAEEKYDVTKVNALMLKEVLV